MFRSTLLIVIFISTCFTYLNANPQVQLPVGSLQGRERWTATGLKYYSYQGVPFAEPPVGSLRFLAPVEKKAWGNVWDATYERNMCHQTYDQNSNANEDCLHLHVFTPVSPSENKSLPVMFWLYGGAFISGSATDNTFGADHLLAKDVIVVMPNYRVGVLGFFSTGDEVIPGNAGLKDQNLALQWVNKYIKYFGGDPNQVTIFGQSAGSASVAYHLLSPLSKGLFKGAILESGSALSPWAYNRNQTKFSLDAAKAINPDEFAKHNSSSKALLKYLQSLDATVVNTASSKIWYPQYIQIQHGFLYAPVVEVNHAGAFLSQKQYEVYRSGSYNVVPIMLGFNSEEEIGLYTDKYFNDNLSDLDTYKQTLIPLDLNEKPSLRQEIAEKIHNKYSPNGTFVQNPRNMIKYMTDQSFVRSIRKHAQLHSTHGHVWLYRFAYKGTMPGGDIKTPEPGYSDDVGHSEELSYIFAFRYNGHNTTDVSTYPQSDINVHNRLVTLWTNFAKYQHPTPKKDVVLQNISWPVYRTSDEQYLDIGTDLRIAKHPKHDQMEFWDEIYNNYGSPPYDSY